MAIHAALEHRTVYRFDRWVRLSPHVVRLRPAPSCRTPILAYSLRVEPEGHFINWQQDPFGNHLARLVFPEPARMLSITVDVVAEMTVINPFDFFLDPDAERYPFSYDPALARDLAPYLAVRRTGSAPSASGWPEVEVPAGGEATVDFLVGVNQRVQQAVAYTTRFEPGVQTPEETLEKGVGSCRDSALAAHPDLSRRWPGRPVRVGLPRSAQGGRDPSRGPSRDRPLILPTCMPGARCTCPGQAGSASTRPRVFSPARATSPWRALPIRPAPPP